MSNFWNKPKSLYDLADEIANRINSPQYPAQGSDVAQSLAGNGSGSETDDQTGSETAPDPSGGQCPNGSKTIQMEVTAYTSGPESTGKRPGNPGYGITRSKVTAGPGTIAAPPNYSFGTRMFVPGYGWGTVEDRGGAIQGNHLDVWFETVEEARQWGRQILDVIVCNA